MKKILKEAGITILIILIAANVMSFLRKPSLESDRLPALQSRLIDGSMLSPEEISDKPLMIYFWGTWCPVCKLEAPNIQAISEKYTVIGIAVDSGDDEQIKHYMNEKKLNFKVINDHEGKWREKFKVEVFPMVFVYDGQGKLRFAEVGYTTTAGLLARMMAAE